MRGRWAMSPIMIILLKRAQELAEGRSQLPIASEEAPPNCNLDPTVEEIDEWWQRYGRTEGAAVDIECAGSHLVCVGLCSLISERYICVRFRNRGGTVHDVGSIRERTSILYKILVDYETAKIFHNGQSFDIPYLEDIGFVINGYEDDTMLMAHLTYAEHPKRLEFLASVYADMPSWKHLVKVEDEPEGK